MQQETKDYVTALASFLVKNKKTMTLKQLIGHLNHNKIDEYHASRGMGQGITSLYNDLKRQVKDNEAGDIVFAFVGEDGEYLWKKK